MALQDLDSERLIFYTMDIESHQEVFARDVAFGLSATPKTLLAKYFYDERGAQLYEHICQLPEYYPYRAEQEILTTYATEIQAELGALPLVELGSGNAAKTRALLSAYAQADVPCLYCPVDIARAMLQETAKQLLQEYPHLSIRALHADFAGNPAVMKALALDHKAIAFFGSSLGNFTQLESAAFLRQTAALMGPDDVFLLGLDLKKSASILIPAYDDAQGVTAAFNLNILQRINHELGGNFILAAFEHLARYNAVYGRIEMHLRSRIAQQVTIARTHQRIAFAAGETIHTENSYKYTLEDIQALGAQAHLALHRTWLDHQGYFVVALFRPESRLLKKP